MNQLVGFVLNGQVAVTCIVFELELSVGVQTYL